MSQPYYVLEIRYADGATESHEIHEERRILGRSKIKADLQVGDKKASGRHAELVFRDGALTVKDLGSTNGTFFDEQRMLESFKLAAGQAFRVGDAQIRLMAVHGLPEEDDAKTMVGAPAWLDELQAGEDSTRALDAVELAALIEQDAQASHPPQPARAPQPAQPVQAPAGGQPLAAKPEPLVHPEPEPWGDEAPDRTRALPLDEMPGLMSKEEVARRDAAAADEAARRRGAYDQPASSGYEDYQPPSGGGYDDQPSSGGYEEYYAPPTGDDYDRAPAPTYGSGGPIRVHFEASGMDMLKALILHILLVPLTLFIYTPWFVVRLRKFIYAHATIVGTPRGNATLEFRGTGGQLFIVGLHALLIPLTLYIYTPWYIMKLMRFTLDNTVARAEDGTEYQLQCALQPVALLKFMVIHGLLNLITLNLYTPWLLCKLGQLFASNTQLVGGGRPVASFSFHGTGGKLFGMWLLGFFLTMITLGIYWFWFQAKLIKWAQENTQVEAGGRRWRGTFAGTGGENFKINLLFGLLYAITLFLYFFWYKVNELKWRWNNSTLEEVRG